jgi:hypothetical protein
MITCDNGTNADIGLLLIGSLIALHGTAGGRGMSSSRDLGLMFSLGMRNFICQITDRGRAS